MGERQGQNDRLNRALGLPSLLFYGVGVIIGAGIYSILGAAAGKAGRGVWLSLLLAAIPAALAALCYAEMSTRFPKAGASYVYLRNALPKHRWPSFMIGFVVASTAAVTAATVAVAFGGYLSLFVDLPRWLSAMLLLGLCTLVNIAGIREAAWATAIGTTIEVIGLVLIIGAGITSGHFGEGILDFESPGVEGGGGFTGIFAATALCFFVFTGFEGLANLSEESRKPERNLPIALFVSVAFTTILYVLVGIAVVALVEPAQLAQSASPLSTAAEAAHPALATTLGWIALFATANTALITVVVGSRLLYGMADHGDMPATLARTLARRRTPWVAAMVILAASAAAVPLGGVAIVGSIASLLTLMIFLSVAASLLILRLRHDEAPSAESEQHTFRVPVSIGRVPLIPIVLAVSIVLLGTQFPWLAYLVAAGVLVAGGLLSLTRRWWGHEDAATEHRAMESIA